MAEECGDPWAGRGSEHFKTKRDAPTHRKISAVMRELLLRSACQRALAS